MEIRIARLVMLGAMFGSPLALFALPAGAGDAPPLSLHAFAMNFTGVGSGGSGEIDIFIERWSTDQEYGGLQSVLAEKGGGALLRVLQQMKPRAGYIQIKPRLTFGSENANWEVRFARSTTLPDGGRRVVLATDRPLTAAERSKHGQLEEYEFLLVEIRLDKEGKGEGRTAEGTKVTFNKNTDSFEGEPYSVEPIKLINVAVFVPKPKG